MLKIVTAAALAVGLAGCATHPQIALEDLDAALAKNEAAASRLYPGKTIPEARKAVHQVLYLLDPKDIVFDVQDNGLMATRWSTYYAVFNVGFGRDWYSVDFTQTDKGVIARLGFDGAMNSGMFVSPIPVSFKPSIPISAHQNAADFDLFHNRVEYVLGLRNSWITCDAAKQLQTNPKKTLFLCDSLGLENKTPDNAGKAADGA